jgi:hypothetical protein
MNGVTGPGSGLNSSEASRQQTELNMQMNAMYDFNKAMGANPGDDRLTALMRYETDKMLNTTFQPRSPRP